MTNNVIKQRGNVLVISDLHLPYHHAKSFNHCRRIRDKYNCSTIIDIGDMFDLQVINFHEKDPDKYDMTTELDMTQREARRWSKEFPVMYHIYGNHSSLLYRQAKSHGLSSRMVKSLNEMFDLPDTWYWADEWEKDDVRYVHGQSKSGKYAYVDYARDNMQSTVTGHSHTTAGTHWIASNSKLVYGFGVGCLVDRHSYGMAYARDFPKKPILGVGVVLNGGTLPIFEPLEL